MHSFPSCTPRVMFCLIVPTGPVAARFRGLQVRIKSEVWPFVSCECCVLSGRGLCVGLINRPEESYRGWCV